MPTPATLIEGDSSKSGEITVDRTGIRFNEGRKSLFAVNWDKATALSVDGERSARITVSDGMRLVRIEVPGQTPGDVRSKLSQFPAGAHLLEGKRPERKTGFFQAAGGSWPLPEHVKQILQRGQTAWDLGRRSFVWRQIATSGLNEEGANDVIDGLLEMGWRLDQTALAFNQVGLNTEVALFVFVRPDSAG